MLYEQITVSGDQITVSLIIWRRFKKPMPGLLEQVYDLNQNLADLGDFLPLNSQFILPVPSEKAAVLNPVTLW